jgi:hypothetical protein
MKYETKLDKIGEHYKLTGFAKLGQTEKADACKKVTGKDTISAAYDHMIANGKASDAKSSKGETVAETPKKVEYIAPDRSGSSHTSLDVKSPVININVPAPGAINVNSQNGLTWGHFGKQALLWTNGVLVGGMGVAILFMVKLS